MLMPLIGIALARIRLIFDKNGQHANSFNYSLQKVTRMDLIMDYKEIAIQYGFLTLFIPGCPFIPIIALVTNVIEVRKDGYKMLQLFR